MTPLQLLFLLGRNQIIRCLLGRGTYPFERITNVSRSSFVVRLLDLRVALYACRRNMRGSEAMASITLNLLWICSEKWCFVRARAWHVHLFLEMIGLSVSIQSPGKDT